MKCLIVAAALCLAIVAPVRADVVVGDFTILNNVPSASGGTIIFTLNPDGTISAALHTVVNLQGFGFDSIAVNLPESNFSPTAPDNMSGWADMYGYHASGFFCAQCGTDESWIIGIPGEFTSALQALGGGNATHAFFYYSADGQQQWAADAHVPEPATLALLALGLAGVGFSRRRKLN